MPFTPINPIIPGFAPDPSIVLVEGTFFLVNSTFHMFPGLPIYASKDLTSWKHIGEYFPSTTQLTLLTPIQEMPFTVKINLAFQLQAPICYLQMNMVT
jgi:beta-xylosidase